MYRNFYKWTAFVVCLMAWSTPAVAQTAPSLGAAQPFAVLGGSTVTNTGPSIITGNLGVSPGSAITGFPPGVVLGSVHSADATAGLAQNAVVTAFNALGAQPCTANLTGQDLGGLILIPGVYCFDSSAGLTGTLTLDGQGNPNAVFIFKTGSTLTTASASRVVTINGAQTCNVFWQIGSSATLGTSSTMLGSILALTSITATTTATVAGRLLARNGAVTLDSNTVALTACAGGPPACPVITISPATLPSATQGTAYTQQLSGSGGTAPYVFTVTSGALPPGLTMPSSGLISGTPTTAGATAFTVRGTDASGCFQERPYVLSVAAPVPTLAQWGMIGLTALLSLAGFAALRRQHLHA